MIFILDLGYSEGVLGLEWESLLMVSFSINLDDIFDCYYMFFVVLYLFLFLFIIIE